jgi:hypothetical protein
LPDAVFASKYNSNANADSRIDTDRNAYTYPTATPRLPAFSPYS